MSKVLNSIPLSNLAEVNPLVPIGSIAPTTPVSFIPMPDVSDTGNWEYRQTRQLRHVQTGYTRFAEGDVLFAKITPCMENGKGAHALGLVNRLGFGSTEFHVLRALPGTDSRFLFHWTQAAELRKAAEAMMTGSAGQRRVPTDFFQRFRVPAVSLPEQRFIAKVLDTADEALRQTEALLGKLKQMKQGLMRDLFTRGLDENGRFRNPVAHPEQYKESALGPIPREWQVRRLDDLAEISSGVTLGRGNIDMGVVELPYLRVANVQDGYLDLTDVKTVIVRRNEVERFALRPGDVLMNEGGDFDKLGRGAVWEGQISPCLHQNHVFRVRSLEGLLDPYFLAAFSGSAAGKKYFVLSSKQSTNLASINSTQLKAYPVPCPSLPEQKRIAAAIRAHDARIRAEEAYLNKLEFLKKGLMQDLLTGRVRVAVSEREPEFVEAGA